MNIVLCESADKLMSTGRKARVDTRRILMDANGRGIILFHNGLAKPIIMQEIIAKCLYTITIASKEDCVFFQYPYYPMLVNRMIFKLLSVGKKIKGYKVSMLIHDVPSIRSQSFLTEKGMRALQSEVNAWCWMDKVICHSKNMQNLFEGVSDFDRYSVLGPFDYIYSGAVCNHTYSSQPIVMFAGNLNKPKCGFVYQLSQIKNVRFSLFGPYYTGEQTENVQYHGVFHSDELIIHLNGQFGLIWDGDSIETCSGYFGEYLKYNSPHKFSLYLAAGVPVIVWDKSALAEYVQEEHIGFTISSLRELKQRLDNLNEQEYDEIVKNVMRVRESIIRGWQLKKAME